MLRSNSYRYNGKELNQELGLEWLDYGARWYDPSIGRFSSIDRFAENYSSMTPYQYGAGNPIKFVDVNGDSIKTYFYNEDGKRVNTIPEQVKQMFQDEYGIEVGYNSETNMLYYKDDVSTDNTVSLNGRNTMISVLSEENPKTELVFGYNLTFKDKITGNKGIVEYGEHIGRIKAGTALIDLADFNQNGTYIGITTSGAFDSRSLNLARTFEHEFMGHGVFGKGGNRQERFNLKKLNEVFRDIPQIIGRDPDTYLKFDGKLWYTAFLNGSRAYFSGNVAQKGKKIKK